MRLKISVKRYSLPTTNIIFTTRALGPSPATSSTDATIAQLLEDVNDIVPLESADWGFEDYAVEVNGYECLHFSPIDAVLRDEDEVVIRALKTQDLRSRRLGGRHQISSDGRHLIDGVAFGRPWLKKGGRPAVQIPPRKRRLKIKGAVDLEAQEAGPLAITGVDYVDECVDEDGEEEEDSDFVDEDGDALFHEDSDGETGPSFVIDTEPGLQIVARQEFHDADDEAEDSSEEDYVGEDLTDSDVSDGELDLSADLQALREEEQLHNTKIGREQQDNIKQPLLNGASDTNPGRHKRQRTFDNGNEDHYGGEFNGFSPPLAKRTRADQIPARSDPSSDSTSSSGSDSDEDDEPSAPLQPTTKPLSIDGGAESKNSSDSSEETSSIDSDSDSDAASGDESSGSSSSSQTSDVADSNGPAPSKTPPKSNFLFPIQNISTPSISPSSAPTRPSVPPGQGSKRTRYTNQRQKKRYRLAALKEQGLLPENATFADMAAYDERQGTSDLSTAAAVDKVIQTKKEELLVQVEEQVKGQGQEQVAEQVAEQNPYMAWEATDKSARSPLSAPRRTEMPLTHASSEKLRGTHTPLHERPAKDVIGSLLASAKETKSEPPKQRARLDLNSTRNMIFNGLGVRKPKTAAAEQALREKLAKPVKGALPKQLFKDTATKQEEGSATLDDSQVPWQTKLVVSAIECELPGVTLKEPPFPFFQGWDEDANRRLRNNKKKGRNQRQYYAYDEDAAMDGYEGEGEEAQNQGDSVRYDTVNGDDILDQLTIKASNLIREARDTLDAKDSNFHGEDTEDLPRPNNFDRLDSLQQQGALPGAVIAYKEFHMNANYQPEISGYRVARIEAVQDGGSLELRVSKQDRKPPRAAKYNETTGERILSRSEMWEVNDDAEEDDGGRVLSYSDLIEPKVLQVPPISNAELVSTSHGAEMEIANRSSPSVLESGVIPESTSSRDSVLVSAQPPVQTVTAAETEKDIDIDVATPRRTEISVLIKEAGFHSSLDSDLLRPINGVTDSAQHGSPGLDVTKDSLNLPRKTLTEPASKTGQNAPDTSGFDSPRFNGWSSSPPMEPVTDEGAEETSLEELPDSSQNPEEQPEEEVTGNESLMLENSITYPHISQLDLDTSIQTSGDKIRGESDGNSATKAESPSRTNLGDPLHLGHSSLEVAEETHPDSLNSVIPLSVDQSQEAQELSARNADRRTTFLGGPDGLVSSDEDELPSLARITSTARSRSSRVSPPPVTRRRKGKVIQRVKSTSPFVDMTASESQPPMKQSQSQSQVRLSQIPPGSQVVDLTFSSDPVSPGNSDGEYARNKRLPRNSNKRKTGTQEAGSVKSETLTVGMGLGNRRLLKSKKAKP
jgi:hypothetical protein